MMTGAYAPLLAQRPHGRTPKRARTSLNWPYPPLRKITTIVSRKIYILV